MRREHDKREKVRELFLGVKSRFEGELRCIRDLKGFDKYDHILELVEEVLEECHFCRFKDDDCKYNKIDGYQFRVYNGRYYEAVGSKDVIAEVFEFLKAGGVPSWATYKIEKRIVTVIFDTIRRRILEPRRTLMCFINGVVDFEEKLSGNNVVLHRFSPKYDVVKQYDFEFNPKLFESCELWRDFIGEPCVGRRRNLDAVLPEKHKRHLLQLFLGALLMDRSRTSFEYFLILQGDGSNGKSVIFRVMEMLFGSDEVSSLDVDSFCKNGDEKLRAGADLVGKRLMYCPEEVCGSPAKMKHIKSLVSGEPLKIRKIGYNVDTLQTPPIVMLNTNHKWRFADFVKGDDVNDRSMTRRVKIINFEHSIPEEKKDTDLINKLWKERAGIFAWVYKGYLGLRKNKYRLPESVDSLVDVLMAQSTANLTVNGKNVSGVVDLYLKRKFLTPEVLAENATRMDIPFDTIYTNFLAFCENEGIESVSPQKFARDLSTIGYDKRKLQDSGRMVYTFYCTDGYVSKNFELHVPKILESAKCKLFLGEEFEDEEFAQVGVREEEEE